MCCLFLILCYFVSLKTSRATSSPTAAADLAEVLVVCSCVTILFRAGLHHAPEMDSSTTVDVFSSLARVVVVGGNTFEASKKPGLSAALEGLLALAGADGGVAEGECISEQLSSASLSESLMSRKLLSP